MSNVCFDKYLQVLLNIRRVSTVKCRSLIFIKLITVISNMELMFQNKCIYFIKITAKVLIYHYLSTAINHWKGSAHNLGHSLWWIYGYFVTFLNFSLNNQRQISIHNLKKKICSIRTVNQLLYIKSLFHNWPEINWFE